ncbi:MAG TPA: DUF5696 domain-containing protein [Anaerolineales bacterium]|nr:DUF5696 domain-containing protein [Anaerolineales bacterium]
MAESISLRRGLAVLIAAGVLLAAGSAGASGAGSPPAAAAAHGQAPPALSPDGRPPVQFIAADPRDLAEVPETYELAAENALFQLYANPETLAFKVVDRRSGYIWHSNLDEKEEEDRLNRTWTAFAQSGISIDYLDRQAGEERNSVTNAEHTTEFALTGDGFEAAVTFTDPSITIIVRVTLDANGVRVDIPFESIEENDPAFKLGLLYVYPFFGATRGGRIPGYMFIPDGAGSLIRFADETKAHNVFYGRYYGADLGMITYLPYDPTVRRPFRISIPVIGMVHGEKENAYIAVVEKGASYGQIVAHPSGIITNFNFLYNSFIYNQSYFQSTNRSGAGVTTLQQNTNAFDISIHYRFLTGEDGDYVGMARSYQKYLVDRGILAKVEDPGADIGISLVFLGGEKEKVLFWHRLIPMTTVEQMAAILDDLGLRNTDVVYYGWQPLGASSMPPDSLKIDRRLGSEGEVRALAEAIRTEGGNFYLYYHPQAAFFEEKGYSPRYDLAMSISRQNLGSYTYYLNLAAVTERFTGLSEDVGTILSGGLALDGIGSTLYSDFKPGHFLNREDAIAAYQELLAGMGSRASFFNPNDYAFEFMRAYYDMPIFTSGYIYATDTVPFLQIVLSGYVPFYGAPMNFSSNVREDLLKHIDFGVYPAYYLTQEITAQILNTPSSWIYTSSYGQWGQEIKETYAWLNALLGPVKGQSIVEREQLRDGVFATTYSNGMRIVVNYTDRPFQLDDLVVDARNALIQDAGQ